MKNRKIKFRVWNNSTKRFESKGFLTSSSEMDKSYLLCGLMEYEQEEDDFGDDGENVVFLQFIGLIDRNGKEIYEGDIVSYHQFLFDGNEHEETGKGIIKSGEYGWILSNIIHDGISDYMGYSKQDQLDGKVETYLINVYGLHEESFEVIGNIYENENLLKNGK